MISTKKHIQQLASLLLAKGIEDIIISPGSRNGPLTHTFVGSGKFNCRNIVDERSAAYFAMGLAQAKQKPVAIVCSSGTATLNYAPAVAEAFYLNIPLVVLTADRPDYWIDQAESQCIRQNGIYSNFIKKEFTLPLGESEKELWYAAREINSCLNISVGATPAPVHINIPLEEPLHDLVNEELPKIKLIEETEISIGLTPASVNKLAAKFNQAERVLILAGQQVPNPGLENILADFAAKTKVVVLNEYLSNLSDEHFCGSLDALMASMLEDDPSKFQPDLLISFGGQFVSKALKQFLRKHQPEQHWHLSLSGDHFDTYQALTQVIRTDVTDFFDALAPEVEARDSQYYELWKGQESKVNTLRDEYLEKLEWSDMQVFQNLRDHLPANSVIHLGNSSPVRYALINKAVADGQYFSNRGTSGIDGCLSTAVGFASESEKINTIILGDLSFMYDSNALWNKYLQSNLRIIVINNRGGNIFSLIKGPSDSPAFYDHFFTENTVKAEGVARTFGLDYFKAGNKEELTQALTNFYSPEQQNPALLEIFTDAEINTKTFRGLFKFVKQ